MHLAKFLFSSNLIHDSNKDLYEVNSPVTSLSPSSPLVHLSSEEIINEAGKENKLV